MSMYACKCMAYAKKIEGMLYFFQMQCKCHIMIVTDKRKPLQVQNNDVHRETLSRKVITLKHTAYLAWIAHDYYSLIVIFLRYACLLSCFQVHCLINPFTKKGSEKSKNQIFSVENTHTAIHMALAMGVAMMCKHLPTFQRSQDHVFHPLCTWRTPCLDGGRHLPILHPVKDGCRKWP